MYLQSYFRAPRWILLSTIVISSLRCPRSRTSSQESGNSAIAAAMDIEDNQSKTWREDPIVE